MLQERMCQRGEQIRGDFDLILPLQEAFDLAHRHSLGVHRDDLGIESSKTLLTFADELGFKPSAPISRYFDLQLPLLADQRLFAAAVAVVFPPLTFFWLRCLSFSVTQVMG